MYGVTIYGILPDKAIDLSLIQSHCNGGGSKVLSVDSTMGYSDVI